MSLEAKILDLLSSAGISTGALKLEPLAVSGNNRTYKLIADRTSFVIKEYFHHQGDDRDRLGAEFSFLTYANQVAPHWVPKPYACDTKNRLALYEFIEGKVIGADQLTRDQIMNAAEFFSVLNKPNQQKPGLLPNASEACFSIHEHLTLIDKRLARLAVLDNLASHNEDASHLIGDISSKWQHVKEAICRGANEVGVDLEVPLPSAQCCISPSDFGFHNALLNGGALKFIDFEYAGWDDPAKMVGDFFAQLAVPVPEVYFEAFVQKSLSGFVEKQHLMSRARLLRPAYQIKWCCIALNVLIPVNLARRKFANPSLDEALLKRTQMTKASRLLESIR